MVRLIQTIISKNRAVMREGQFEIGVWEEGRVPGGIGQV